ncbi:MAG: hypothetical protein ACTSVO_14110 [Candidatus Heimdallarchaeaceae archaeon]
MGLEIYALIAAIVLFALGFLMILGWVNFIIYRYESFQRIFRKKDFSVNKEGLSKYYSILFFVTGTPLLIGAIIGLINPNMFSLFSIWLFVAVAAIGIVGIVYCNVSNRFIKTLEDATEESFKE